MSKTHHFLRSLLPGPSLFLSLAKIGTSPNAATRVELTRFPVLLFFLFVFVVGTSSAPPPPPYFLNPSSIFGCFPSFSPPIFIRAPSFLNPSLSPPTSPSPPFKTSTPPLDDVTFTHGAYFQVFNTVNIFTLWMNGPELLNSPSRDMIIVKSVKSAISITMNRPRQLNALSFNMVRKLLEIFLTYENDGTVQLVIMKGNGKAFCCGGDVVAVVHNTKKVGWKSAAEFFQMEYKLNFVMASYRKLQVSILNGIVMGGGAGTAVHGRFRVSTENSVFAMPETAIGLFPDVGASYFLSRLPGFFGEYLGLTGARLDGAEMLACGLSTHFVPSSVLPSLEEALYNANSSDPHVISAIISSFSQQPDVKEGSSLRKLDTINKCFSRRTVEEILAALEENVRESDDWLVETLTALRKASPISLKISLAAVRKGRVDDDIGCCLVRDFRMACHSLRGDVSRDFFEGCRALLIDKDKMPKWEPSRLEDVSEEMVDKYFSKIDAEDWKDLQFPPRVTPKL